MCNYSKLWQDSQRTLSWDVLYSADRLSGPLLTQHIFQCECQTYIKLTFTVHILRAGFSAFSCHYVKRLLLMLDMFSFDTSILNVRDPARMTFRRENISVVLCIVESNFVIQILDQFLPRSSYMNQLTDFRLDVLRVLRNTGSKNKSIWVQFSLCSLRKENIFFYHTWKIEHAEEKCQFLLVRPCYLYPTKLKLWNHNRKLKLMTYWLCIWQKRVENWVNKCHDVCSSRAPCRVFLA